MNFLRRATIALITGVLSLSTIAVMATPADAAKNGGTNTQLRDTSWPF